MKVLLDSCVWGGARGVVTASGHDVQTVADVWGADPGDHDILAWAFHEGHVLVTLDKDFGELAILRGAPHAGLVRLAGLSARTQGLAIVEVLANHGESLRAGAVITVEPDRVRIRLAE